MFFCRVKSLTVSAKNPIETCVCQEMGVEGLFLTGTWFLRRVLQEHSFDLVPGRISRKLLGVKYLRI